MNPWMHDRYANRELLIFLAICLALMAVSVSVSRGETPTTKPSAEVVKASVPEKLVGKWSYGSVSPTTYWDSDTGKFLGNARGSAGIIEFNSDGTYKQYICLEMRTYGLVTTVWTIHGGSVAFDGSKVTFRPTSGHYKSDSGSRHIDRDMTEKEPKDNVKTYAWRTDKDAQGRETFVIPFEDGSKFEYRRAEK